MIDALNKIECRQVSADTYQLRSPSHILTIPKAGFELYRSGDMVAYDDWLTSSGLQGSQRPYRDF